MGTHLFYNGDRSGRMTSERVLDIPESPLGPRKRVTCSTHDLGINIVQALGCESEDLSNSPPDFLNPVQSACEMSE